METIIFGPDLPKIDLTADPQEGSIQYEIQNENVLSFESSRDTITWLDLGRGATHKIRERATQTDKEPHPLSVATRAERILNRAQEHGEGLAERQEIENETLDLFGDLYRHLESMTGSKYEAKFLELYVQSLIERAAPLEEIFAPGYERDKSEIRMGVVWPNPVLIPQVWVNWIHHDPKDRERAQTRSEEPFRVDFLLVDQHAGDRPIVIEIDGLTHFGSYGMNEAGEKTFEPSLNEYTEHIKKDRWLKNQGWDVVRITNQEVEELEERGQEDPAQFPIFLYREVLGTTLPGFSD